MLSLLGYHEYNLLVRTGRKNALKMTRNVSVSFSGTVKEFMVRQVSVQFTQYLYFLDNVNSHCVEVGLVYSACLLYTSPSPRD